MKLNKVKTVWEFKDDNPYVKFEAEITRVESPNKKDGKEQFLFVLEMKINDESLPTSSFAFFSEAKTFAYGTANGAEQLARINRFGDIISGTAKGM